MKIYASSSCNYTSVHVLWHTHIQHFDLKIHILHNATRRIDFLVEILGGLITQIGIVLQPKQDVRTKDLGICYLRGC